MVHNVYYNPEKFGLSIVAQIQYIKMSGHIINTRVVWAYGDRFLTHLDTENDYLNIFGGIKNVSQLEDADPESLVREVNIEMDNKHIPDDYIADNFINTITRAMTPAPDPIKKTERGGFFVEF